MNSKIIRRAPWLIAVIFGIGLLTGCTQDHPKLNPSAQHYQNEGLVAPVKGTISTRTTLRYQIGQGKTQKAQVNDGTFVIQVPGQLKKTTVKLTAARGQHKIKKAVTVAKNKPLLPYARFAVSYNVINQQMQTGAEALPISTTDGLQDLSRQDGRRVRANIQDGKLVGIAYITPIKNMKTKAQVKQFALQLVALANSVGADGQQVLKDYQKLAKDAENGQTTVANIHSKGITFETNFSSEALYMYLVKK